jgi:hypothetical protein
MAEHSQSVPDGIKRVPLFVVSSQVHSNSVPVELASRCLNLSLTNTIKHLQLLIIVLGKPLKWKQFFFKTFSMQRGTLLFVDIGLI